MAGDGNLRDWVGEWGDGESIDRDDWKVGLLGADRNLMIGKRSLIYKGDPKLRFLAIVDM